MEIGLPELETRRKSGKGQEMPSEEAKEGRINISVKQFPAMSFY